MIAAAVLIRRGLLVVFGARHVDGMSAMIHTGVHLHVHLHSVVEVSGETMNGGERQQRQHNRQYAANLFSEAGSHIWI